MGRCLALLVPGQPEKRERTGRLADEQTDHRILPQCPASLIRQARKRGADKAATRFGVCGNANRHGHTRLRLWERDKTVELRSMPMAAIQRA